MEKKIKITVITVVFNAAKTIEKTIQSVINQTYKEIEYIIVDGGSTDGTLDIIKKYEKAIAYWNSEPDKGIYDAMNKGLEKASGNYIYFLGADDCLCDEKVILEIAKNIDINSTEILSGKIIQINQELLLKRVVGRPLISQEILEKGIMPPHQGIFVRQDIMKKYKFDCAYKAASDYDFISRALLNNIKIKFSNNKIAYCLTGGCSANRTLVYGEYKNILKKNRINNFRAFYFRKINGLLLSVLEKYSPDYLIKFILKFLNWKVIK